MQVAAAAAGLTFERFDTVLDAAHNILTRSGLVLVLSMVMRVKENGLLVLGPPCGMWVFMSQSVHKRTRRQPEGDITVAKVREANMIARIVAGIVKLAVSRNVRFIIEQPISSQLFHFPAIAKVIQQVTRVGVQCLSNSSWHWFV